MRMNHVTIFAYGFAIAVLIIGGAWAVSAAREPKHACTAAPDQYCLASTERGPIALNEVFAYDFTVYDAQGQQVTNFAKDGERILHLFVMRDDLTGFQHVHPELNPVTGTFHQVLQFTAPGHYQLFANFVPGDKNHAAAGLVAQGESAHVVTRDELTVERTRFDAVTIVPQRLDTIEDYEITLASDPDPIYADRPTTLRFSINKNGMPLTDFGRYLGSFGHTVLVRQKTFEFAHLHSETLTDSGELEFTALFPESGLYKVFAQFQHEGRVLTADFAVEVR